MTAYQVIERLAATDSKLEKEQIVIDAWMTGERQFFRGAQLAYDPLVTFGVTLLPNIGEADLDPSNPGDFTWDDFLALADKLRTRALTGHAARDALLDAAHRCHGPTWNGFYRRVLRKDFACGATDGTINRALGKLKGDPEAKSWLVPVFEAQLAHDAAKPPHNKKLVGKKMLDVKLDGVRLLTALDKRTGEITQFTRDGKVNDRFDLIRRSLEPLMEAIPFPVMLDGEVTGKSFQQLMTQLNRGKKVDTSTAKLALFDMVPLDDFHAGVCRIPQQDRHAGLTDLATSGLLGEVTGGRVYVVPKIMVDLDTPDGQFVFKSFNNDAIAAGYEGIMVKDPLAPYRTGRNAAWLKIKPVISLTMEVLEVLPGKAEGKRETGAGAFLLRCMYEGKPVRTKCGSGFSDENVREFWERRSELPGFFAEIEADALTLEQNGTEYSLRFPRFKGLRGFQPGEII